MHIDYDNDYINTVVGTDGYSPSRDPDARWNEWSMHEVYFGKEGKNKYVPKVKDYVRVPETGDQYIVVKVDEVTAISELAPAPHSNKINLDRIISYSEQNNRIYLDTSQMPYTLTPDTMLKTHSYDATTYRVYRGTLLDENQIVSKVYNNSGDLIGHDVPLVLAMFDTHDINNISVKSLPSCKCDVDLRTGELCTIAIFNAAGRVVSTVTALVENTTFIPPAYANQKFITDIYLKSTFLNEPRGNVINFPANLTIDSLSPIGVVVYNDGSEEEYIVDGKKFDIYGLGDVDNKMYPNSIVNSFASVTVGHTINLVLVYRLEDGEATTAAIRQDPKAITKPYSLVVSEPNRSYGVKLFAYPRWVNNIAGYELDFYLLNLDRDLIYPVTSLVKLAENSRAFNPSGYGMSQVLTYMIDLSDISSSFDTFVHSQTIEVILRGRGDDDTVRTSWEVSSQFPSNTPFFGTETRAKLKASDYVVNIQNGCKTVKEFLDKHYITTDPLMNPTNELEPVRPTHIGIRYLNHQVEGSVGGHANIIPIEDFSKDIRFNKKLKLYDNIEVVFYRQTIGNYLTLSVCHIPIRK